VDRVVEEEAAGAAPAAAAALAERYSEVHPKWAVLALIGATISPSV